MAARISYFLIGDSLVPGVRERVFNYCSLLKKEEVDSIYHYVGEVPTTGRLRYYLNLARELRNSNLFYNYRVPFTTKEQIIISSAAHALVFDFDDNVFAPPPDRNYDLRLHAEKVKRHESFMKRCDLIIAGNSYLADIASKYCGRVSVVHTPIDVGRFRKKNHTQSGTVTIGWIGTGSNLVFLEKISTALSTVFRNYSEARLKVVSDTFPSLPFEFTAKQWKYEDEPDDIDTFDIGIMPLDMSDHSQGKCGYKALQCMAAGIPVVATRTKFNAEIIADGKTGFLAVSENEWIESLMNLIRDPRLRAKMGETARHFVSTHFDRPVVFKRLFDTIKRFI